MANNQGASGYDYRAIGEEDELENTAMEAAPASPSRESRLKWRPTNTMLLMVAGVSFGVFAVAEMVAAFESNSLSLLGDASTMIVDSMTYGLNMYAELRKPHVSGIEALKLELYAPLMSVIVLIGISLYIFCDSIGTISNPPEQSVDDYIMMVFATINLILDVLNIMCFHRANRVFGFPTRETDEGDVANTNMCSAYTHVIADTFRSLAVLFAAMISSNSDVNADIADGWAAIAVSFIIAATTIPLFAGLVEKYRMVRDFPAQQQRENGSMDSLLTV